MLRRTEEMNTSQPMQAPMSLSAIAQTPIVAGTATAALASKLRLRTLFALPVAILIALVVHWAIGAKESLPEMRLFSRFLIAALCASLAAAVLQLFWLGLRKWMRQTCPIIAAAVFLMTVWDII